MSKKYIDEYIIFCKNHNFKSKYNNNKTTIIMNSPKKAKQYCIISQTKGYNFGIKETRKLCKVDNFILIYNIKRIHTKVIKNDRSYD